MGRVGQEAAAETPRVTARVPALTCREPGAVTSQPHADVLAPHLGVRDAPRPPTACGANACLPRTSVFVSQTRFLRNSRTETTFPFHGPMEFAICDCLVKKKKKARAVPALNAPRFQTRGGAGEHNAVVGRPRPRQTRFASIGSVTSSAMYTETNLSLVFS